MSTQATSATKSDEHFAFGDFTFGQAREPDDTFGDIAKIHGIDLSKLANEVIKKTPTQVVNKTKINQSKE